MNETMTIAFTDMGQNKDRFNRPFDVRLRNLLTLARSMGMRASWPTEESVHPQGAEGIHAEPSAPKPLPARAIATGADGQAVRTALPGNSDALNRPPVTETGAAAAPDTPQHAAQGRRRRVRKGGGPAVGF